LQEDKALRGRHSFLEFIDSEHPRWIGEGSKVFCLASNKELVVNELDEGLQFYDLGVWVSKLKATRQTQERWEDAFEALRTGSHADEIISRYAKLELPYTEKILELCQHEHWPLLDAFTCEAGRAMTLHKMSLILASYATKEVRSSHLVHVCTHSN
jgi:hypothetical protein